MSLNDLTLPNDISELKAIIMRQQRDIAYLEELVKLFQHKKFSSSNEENRHPGERFLFDEAEAEYEASASSEEEQEQESKPSRPKKTSGRKPLPDVIPRVERIIDLADDQKFCPFTGVALRRVGEEVNEQLNIIPAKLEVIRTVRPKYACSCGQCSFRVARLSPSLIPKSMAAPGLLAYVATAKYADALPLHRQESILQRIGCDLPRATLSQWMIKCGEALTPVINLLRERMLEAPLVYSDETTVQVLKGTGKQPTSKSFMWVQAKWGGKGQRIVLYTFSNSRSGEVPLKLFEGYRGFVQTDGYEGYNKLSKVDGITLVGDWVHVRRKFHDVIKVGGNSQKSLLARKALEYIARLYEVESKIKDRSLGEKLDIRKTESSQILLSLRTWVDETYLKVPPKSLIGKAFNYFNEQWPKLCYFLDDPIVGLDTNVVENSIRPFAIGRKNWMFSDTVRGADASANLYSLIITAKANDLNPYEYLCRVFSELPACETLEDFERLLPMAR